MERWSRSDPPREAPMFSGSSKPASTSSAGWLRTTSIGSRGSGRRSRFIPGSRRSSLHEHRWPRAGPCSREHRRNHSSGLAFGRRDRVHRCDLLTLEVFSFRFPRRMMLPPLMWHPAQCCSNNRAPRLASRPAASEAPAEPRLNSRTRNANAAAQGGSAQGWCGLDQSA